ncbi:MAG TPA: alpha/beta hydrolase-fold protein [Patescibacteria group bacterium]|nr:alpha/beta hydrolase-fold protein [Patescibacteria group bacterium]
MKNRIMAVLILVLLTLLSARAVCSQDEGNLLAVANYLKIPSRIMNEERTIVVSLPYLYDRLGKRYPVLYVLDGEDITLSSFIGMARFFSPQRIPEMIIVGVLNTNRNRDLFATRVEGLPDTKEDGAIRFLSFLSKELIPYVDTHYRTTSHRTIYGQSAGGQFAIFSLLTDPEVFDAYLASSPVIGYSDQVLLNKAEAFFKPGKVLNKSLYVYYGTTDYHSVTERIPLLESIIRKNPPQGFTWKIKAVDGGHVPRESFHELIMMLYSNWSPIRRPTIIPSQGELLKGQTLSVQILGGADPVHYTVNGEEPSDRSPEYTGPIPIDRTTTLKARSIRPGLQETRAVEAQFQVIDHRRPSRKVLGLRPGLKFQYSEQQVFTLPDRLEGTPMKSGVVPTIDLGVRERNHLYLIEYDGYIKVPKSGRYRLSLRSTSVRFFLDQDLVMANGGLLPEETVRDLCLESGVHAIRIVTRMFLQPSHVLELCWEGPGIGKQIVPAQAYYHD